jgi:glycosyltransferase involved in cell wall biosynthesis
VPNAADLDLFRPAPPPADMRISYFGALGEANDVTAAVEAARLLPDVSFVLMGDGKRRPELERSAPPNVEFRSGTKADVARLAAGSSACLTLFKDVPVLATNSPNKLFDTFAAGRPAIVNMDGWMRELVECNEAGLYVRAGDAQDLAEKVAWLRDNPDAVERMGRNARALAEREFGRDELAARALTVLEEAAR